MIVPESKRPDSVICIFRPPVNATGRVTSVATETSSQIDYTYDNQGRLKTVTTSKRNGIELDPAETTIYKYTLVGSRKSVEYPNEVTTTYSYNSANQLRDVHIQNAASDTLAQYAYTLGANGRRDSVVETDNDSNETTIHYGYDALGRLTSETHDAPSVSSDYTIIYTYDLVGNRLSKTRSGSGTETATYEYNSNDQLTTETIDGENTTYGYDANGSMTSKAVDGVELAYTYNIAQRLVQMDNGDWH